jgi:hypothetical protein
MHWNHIELSGFYFSVRTWGEPKPQILIYEYEKKYPNSGVPVRVDPDAFCVRISPGEI